MEQSRLCTRRNKFVSKYREGLVVKLFFNFHFKLSTLKNIVFFFFVAKEPTEITWVPNIKHALLCSTLLWQVSCLKFKC